MATAKDKLSTLLGNTSAVLPVSTNGTTEDSQVLKADEVQDIVKQNARSEGQNAAAAAALQVEGNPMQLNNIGRNGNGYWYSLVGPGGTVKPENAAAFLAMGPGAYSSPYTPAMQELMNQLLTPEQFQYDVNADGLYQQIKDNYTKAGRQAMMDTQGQSAALTGGYGNSYGAMAGQQAYQESLGSMAGMIPELQQLAYQQYLNNEDAKRNNLEALNKLDAQEYARWQDEMAAYQEMLKTLPDPDVYGGGGYGPSAVGGPLERRGASIYTMTPGAGNKGVLDMNTYTTYKDFFDANPGAAQQALVYMNNGGSYKQGYNSDIEKAAISSMGYDWNTTGREAAIERSYGTIPGTKGANSTPGTGQQTSSQSVAQRNTQFLKNVVQGIAGIFGPKK